MGLPVPVHTSPSTKADQITIEELINTWKMTQIIIPEYVVHQFRAKEVVWSFTSMEERQTQMLKRKICQRIYRLMSATKDINEYERTEPIDCGITEFLSMFDQLPRYLFQKNKKPKKVHKDHVFKIINQQEFKRILGCEPTIKTIPKKVLNVDSDTL